MHIRTFLIIPAALVVAVLAGCGQGQASGVRSGSERQFVPSSSVCYEPWYIRQHAPDGLCAETTVVDDRSPLGGP
ncbi:hypothetical protein [Agromyces laixinhei]|uniref:hypothetical protein n=1 Tax=Agromyces laixinhei TaxID=2585717 RepID=UPI0018DB2E56|nr:hypothetical protein [Agromyces laixinhei]